MTPIERGGRGGDPRQIGRIRVQSADAEPAEEDAITLRPPRERAGVAEPGTGS